MIDNIDILLSTNIIALEKSKLEIMECVVIIEYYN